MTFLKTELRPLSTITDDDLLEEEIGAGSENGACATEADERQVQIPIALHGERLDRCLAQLLPEFSRSYLQALLVQGFVRSSVLASPVHKASLKVKAGEVYQVRLEPTDESNAYTPQAMPLEVVYEDAHLRVIHKPAGLVVHPAPGNWSGTLLNGLLALDAQAAQVPRAGIVHRLDKDTSGLMVVARTRAAMDALVALIAAREVKREYLAIAHRPWVGSGARELTSPIGRDPRNRLRMAVVDLARQPGKEAHTTVTCWDSNATGCLLHCQLHTGRTHQIRVHLSAIGHPLLSDTTYGGRTDAGLARQALHAFRLSFVHPLTGQLLVLQAPLPSDMQEALRVWGLSYNEKHG